MPFLQIGLGRLKKPFRLNYSIHGNGSIKILGIQGLGAPKEAWVGSTKTRTTPAHLIFLLLSSPISRNTRFVYTVRFILLCLVCDQCLTTSGLACGPIDLMVFKIDHFAKTDQFTFLFFDNRGTGDSDEPPGPYS